MFEEFLTLIFLGWFFFSNLHFKILKNNIFFVQLSNVQGVITLGFLSPCGSFSSPDEPTLKFSSSKRPGASLFATLFITVFIKRICLKNPPPCQFEDLQNNSLCFPALPSSIINRAMLFWRFERFRQGVYTLSYALTCCVP